MDIKEAYKTMQAEWVKLHDVKVGTKVRVLRDTLANEMGYYGLATYDADREDSIAEIACNSPCNGIRLGEDIGSGCWYPFFALEVVGQPDVKKMTVKEISEMAGCTVEVIE